MPATERRILKCKITSFIRLGPILILTGLPFLFISQELKAQSYYLNVLYADSGANMSRPALLKTFQNEASCKSYIESLPQLLRQKGFAGASVDSVFLRKDTALLYLYLGALYRWGNIQVDALDEPLLQAIGYREKQFVQRDFDFSQMRNLQEKIIRHLENNGYPFASITLDSFKLESDALNPRLQINKGLLYKIDSIRIFGDANISNRFIQRFLDVPAGSIYRKQRLLDVDRKLRQLPYLIIQQPSDISYLGNGALLNIYLKGRKSSQINGLIGFLPSAESTGARRLLVTGDFNLNLKNSFGFGESILFMFQQIQVQSPRLKLSYQQPFLFGSPFGTELLFEGFKKDSSFLNIRYQLGAEYAFGSNKSGKIFFQQFITALDYIDTLAIKRANRLPDQIDQTTTSVGADYEWWNTDYRFNPRNGFDIKLQASAGVRQIRKNNTITSLVGDQTINKDYRFLYDSLALRTYAFRMRGTAARYFKTGRQTVLKTAVNAGWVQSPNLFRNELFQLGGFQLLRGFDDESFFASAFTVITTEYRILTGQNSFLYAFIDGGWLRNQSQSANTALILWGTGLGATIDSKAGVFNVAFALGKREDLPVNFRQLKIHFGYLNFF